MADMAIDCVEYNTSDISMEQRHFSGKSVDRMPSLANASTSPTQFFTLPFRKRRRCYTINPPDDTYNVVYLGNVLTVMAKGDGCVEKPLNLIWKTYCSKQKSDLQMKLAVTRSGLKAETKQQGLTEYWAHRITFCLAPSEYPRLFCWVYKHEGKRMKPELRCHAVLCKKASEPTTIAVRLNDFLQAALQEYRREKLSMQNARLNATAVGQVATCPKRKLLLQTGTLNFRPPVSRSKSAPRLGSIEEEEILEDEEDEEEEEQQEEEDLSDLESLCYRDSPAVDDECVSSSATSSSSSSSPFLRQSSLVDRVERDEQQSDISDCTIRLSSSLTLEAAGGSSGPSSIGSDEGFNSTSEVSERTSGALRGALNTGCAWIPQRRASAAGPRRYSYKDPDTVSDESGYHDGAVSLSDDEFVLPEEEEFDEDECDVQAQQ
uniref:PID domain-containing protein n=1 Tax=Parascaris univalens TaxID=6257 RepID=A0A915ABY6_PARUN